MTTKTNTDTMRQYIAQAQQLDAERSNLIAELSALPESDIERFNQIEKRLTSIYHAQSSNAVILADMLESVINGN